MNGTFWGIGVGPGDPDLLTIKAMKAMKQVDIIIAPKTEKKEGSVALSIAQPYLRDDVEIVYQVFPMVANFADSSAAWEKNKAEIQAFLHNGKSVAFLTLGDPMFYSTYIYIYRLLKAAHEKIITVPGVPSFCAIGSKLGYPIVEGNDVLSIVPATADKAKIEKALAASDNVVLMKVYKNFADIVDMLAKYDMAEQSVMVSRCDLPGEDIICDIVKQKDKKVNYLSTILTRRNK